MNACGAAVAFTCCVFFVVAFNTVAGVFAELAERGVDFTVDMSDIETLRVICGAAFTDA